MSGAGVLLDALVVRSLLVPATVSTVVSGVLRRIGLMLDNVSYVNLKEMV